MLYAGLDLGKSSDFAAFVVTDRLPLPVPRPKRRWSYDVRHLKVWDLGTDYTVIAEGVAALYRTPQLARTKLVVDATGVGAAVVDMLKSKRVNATLYPVVATGGRVAHKDEKTGYWNVPKQQLVTTLQVVMQDGLVRVDPALKLAPRLARELKEFRVQITKAANETFGAGGSHHDDLVRALMDAVWVGEQSGAPANGIGTAPAGDGSVLEKAPDGVFL